MSRQLPPHPSLEQLKKQAKDLHKAHKQAEPDALLRIKEHLPRLSQAPESEIGEAAFLLQDAQLVLDPDGDIVCWLARARGIEPDAGWACYQTDLYAFTHEGIRLGIVGCAVGAPFAVLVAEELFASGCELLISVTSAGQITPIGDPPYFILIEKTLRDEGTSYHYLPPAPFSHIFCELLTLLDDALLRGPVPVHCGATWTTDAPFRETDTAIAHCRDLGIMAVEMEAAALYAFAEARQKPVVHFAHVTNQMARVEGDFETGADGGGQDALRALAFVARAWQSHQAT